MPVRAVNGHCLKCGYRLAWIVIKGKQPARHQSGDSYMLNPYRGATVNQTTITGRLTVF